jgi:hypothetical protein
MELSVKHRRSLSEMAVAFIDLKEFVTRLEDGPSTPSASIVELGTVCVNDGDLAGKGAYPLVV